MKIFIDSKDPSKKILVIEDDNASLENILKTLKKSFPVATIHSSTKLDGEIKNSVKENQYDAIFLDGQLKNGNLKIFENWGGNLIPHIKESSPGSIIVGISSSPIFNSQLCKEGAHIAIRKFDLVLTKLDENLTVID